MHNCEKIQDLMLDYFDGKLDADQIKALNRHLETCAQCRDLFEGMEALMNAEKSLPRDTPPDLHEQIMGAVHWDMRLERLRTRSRRRAWIAAACACLVLFGAGTLSLLRIGGMKSDSSANGTASDAAAPESNEFIMQDEAYNDTDGAGVPQDNGDAGADGDAVPEDDQKSETVEDAAEKQTLDAVVSALQPADGYARIVLCDVQDPAALEEASGVQIVEIEGYEALVLGKDVFDTLLAREILSGTEDYKPDLQLDLHGTQVLVILRR
jgi:hypothetical protein